MPEANVTMVHSPEEAEPFLAEADVIITFGPMLGARAGHVFETAKKLKWVQALGTGVDNITDIATLKSDVVVTKMHGIHGPAVSEAAIATMLALGRDLPLYLKNQETGTWRRPRPPQLLFEKTAGIFGVGAIARELAPRLKALGMKVVGFSSSVREIEGFDAILPRSDFVDALPELDHFVILTPLTDDTRNIIGADAFAAMKPSAYLINLARGGVVDEDALIKALEEKQIAGAALDVFSTEPLPSDHPLWRMDSVIVTPHTGGFNDTYPKAALPVVIENMKRFIAGERSDLVNLVER